MKETGLVPDQGRLSVTEVRTEGWRIARESLCTGEWANEKEKA